MSDVEREWFSLKIRLALLEKTASEFQDFFADAMEAAFPGDFQRVRPYGNKGDLKCDGLLGSTGNVFQVYAPRETKEAAMVAKVKVDFEGACKHWKDTMKLWSFVHNDGQGLPPGVVQLLDKLKKQHKKLIIDSWPPSRIEDVALTIPRGKLVTMFGRPPQRADFDRLGFAPVAKVLAAIHGQAAISLDSIEPVSPEKLQANALGAGVAEYLTMGRRREELVQDYLDRQPDPTLGDTIAAAFRDEYLRLRNAGSAPDEIFVELQRFAGSSTRGDVEHETAVLAVLSYLFERCDIFEAPPKAQP